LYTQCTLRKKNTYQVSWIPAKFGKVGQVVKLKTKDDKWDDGWVVETAGEPDVLPDDSRKAIREHRKRTGDALPKIKDENANG